MAKNDLTRQAQAMTESLFSGARPENRDRGGADQAARRPEKPKEDTRKEGGQKRSVYSVRMDPEIMSEWKTYVYACGADAGAMLEAALKEYMRGHQLTGTEKQLFDLKRKTNR